MSIHFDPAELEVVETIPAGPRFPERHVYN